MFSYSFVLNSFCCYVAGGTTVTVAGTNFFATVDSFARFNTYAEPWPCTYVTASRMTCLSLPAAAAFNALEVTLNIQDYTSSNTGFTYHGAFSLLFGRCADYVLVCLSVCQRS